MRMPDFRVNDQGTIVILTPCTEAAKDWVAEHIPDDAQWFGGGIVIEHRYADDIIDGAINDGLMVE